MSKVFLNDQPSVLISIRPGWCEKIFDGSKTIELRKTEPDCEAPFRCYVYETQGKTSTPWMDEDGHLIFRGRGMVIGEFICDRIVRFDVPFPAYMEQVDTKLLKAACLSYREAHAYLGHRSGKGWHITKPKLYDKPRPLTNFHRPCPNGLYCESCAMYQVRAHACGNYALEIKRPPQSWMYAEDQT